MITFSIQLSICLAICKDLIELDSLECNQVAWVAFLVCVNHENVWVASKALDGVILISIRLVRWFDQVLLRKFHTVSKDDFS